MANRSIQSAPIRRWFGLYNFYQDTLHTPNMRHLEEKLGELENKVAVVIENIHKAATKPGNRDFTLVRSDLQILRRFIFIMHYRSSAVEKTYFQEDHPRNIGVRNWIRKLKVDNGYTNDKQIWLRGLQYYLDTGHSDILAHAKVLQACKPNGRMAHAELDVNTPPEHWFALAYESLANNYYMGIWRASDNAEFILGHSTYGLWEGTVANSPKLFRIYVLSPTITLVLKLNVTKNPLLAAMESSTLSDHPLQLPRTTYSRPPRILANSLNTRQRERFDALQTHLQSTSAANDQFTFTINALSTDQAYLVNQVVLENLQADGSLVFKSKGFMLDTARRYDTPEGPFRKKNRAAIAALAACLSGPSSASTSPGTPAAPSPPAEPISAPSPVRTRLLLDKAFDSGLGFRVSEYDLAFDDMLKDILEGSIEFRSSYDRARYIFLLFPSEAGTVHPLAVSVRRQMLDASRYIEVMQAMSGLSEMPMPAIKHMLVESLDRDDATHLLNLVEQHFEIWEKDWVAEEPIEDEGDRISKEVKALAYLHLLMDVDYRLAFKICHSVSFTVTVPQRCEPAAEFQPVAHDVSPVQRFPSTNSLLHESRAISEPNQSNGKKPAS